MSAREIAARGRAMLAFVDRVRERGGCADVEETIDLPVLRAMWLVARAAERAAGGRS